MNDAQAIDATTNPFSTRWVRPGAMPYLFPPGQSAALLAEKLREQHWCGQITGPHGSGKSTLLATLLPEFERLARRPEVFTLRDGQRSLGAAWSRRRAWGPNALVIVDGYEQLSRWSRFRLRRACRRNGWGLLATAHESVGLADLYCTATSLELATRIVERLAREGPPIAREEIAESLAARHGNLREVLFDLYDLYEARCGRIEKTAPDRLAGKP